jgi:hypothetical protein
MFWAKTSPDPEATTDFGERFPVKVRSSDRVRAEEALAGIVVVVVAGGGGGWVAVASTLAVSP